jgi:hypothetical protein
MGTNKMNKSDVKIFFDLYLHESGETYKANRYVCLERAGFKPEEEELKKIIKQRVEGVDSAFHEMNRRMLARLMRLKDEVND